MALTEEERKQLVELQNRTLSPRKAKVAGVVSAIFLLLLLTTTHETHMELYFSVGAAALILLGIVLDGMLRRSGWRR